MARKRNTAEPIIGTRREAEVALAQGENVGHGRPAARGRGAAGLPLAAGVRLPAGGPGEAPQGAGAREHAAEEAGGRPGAGQRHPQGGRVGKFLSPARRRQAVTPARTALVVSERRACRVLAPPPSPQRHPARVATDEPARIARIIARARRVGRSGSRRITALRRAAGWRGAPQAGGAAVASGGAARAPHSPAAAATLGHRRLLHAAPSGAAEPRRVRRLRPRADAGRPGPAPADQRGRVPAGVPQQRRRPAPALRRRPRPADGALRAARPAGLPPLRHRPGVHRASGALLAAAARRDHALHRTGQSLGERVWGILHRHAPRRGSQPGDLHHPDRGPDPHRALAPRVQPGPAPQRPRLPPARPRRAGDPTSPPRPLGRQGLVHGPSMDALLGPAVKRRQRPGAPAALRHAVLGDAESAALQAPARAAHDSGLRARRREFWGAALRFGTPV